MVEVNFFLRFFGGRMMFRTLTVLLVAPFIFAGCAVSSGAEQTQGKTYNVETLRYWPKKVDETSGLARHGGYLWTINDSGGKASVYAFDEQTYEFSKRVDLKGAENIDWESLAQDEQSLYVADCGSNLSHRRVLQIYRVRWADLESADNKGDVTFDKLIYSYDDRPSYPKPEENNFDCEAVTLVDGQIWVFTKNRGDLKSRLYILDPKTRSQIVAPTMTLPVHGLITAADYHSATGKLALLGYKKASVFGQSFVWLVDVKEGILDWQSARYHLLLPYGQWEAVSWESSSSLLVTSEDSPLGRQQVARIVLEQTP